MYEDITLQCADCGCDFEFTAGEQEFYASKGLTNTPKRCPQCRNNRKRMSRGAKKRMYDIICSDCGAEAQVPFRPTEGKPAYCRECFAKYQQQTTV
jgi:CxxC-x17-CxxC domain-containing protein